MRDPLFMRIFLVLPNATPHSYAVCELSDFQKNHCNLLTLSLLISTYSMFHFHTTCKLLLYITD